MLAARYKGGHPLVVQNVYIRSVHEQEFGDAHS